jgi:NADPH2 dehydrogenase
MGMNDPLPQFTYLCRELKERFPSLAYLHVVEPRVDAGMDRADGGVAGATNDPIRAIWTPKPYISAGGFQPETAFQSANEHNDLIAFGRYFIANVRNVCINMPSL